MWSAFFFSRHNALTAPLSMRDPLLRLGTWPCALRPRLSGNKASEEHQLSSDETNKKLCAHNKYMQSTDKEGETILSSHKKGTAPGKKISKHLSDHTGMGPFLKNNVISLSLFIDLHFCEKRLCKNFMFIQLTWCSGFLRSPLTNW